MSRNKCYHEFLPSKLDFPPQPLRGFAWAWMALHARNASPWLHANFLDFEPPEQVSRTSARAHTCAVLSVRAPCAPRSREHEKRSASGRAKNADVQKKTHYFCSSTIKHVLYRVCTCAPGAHLYTYVKRLYFTHLHTAATIAVERDTYIRVLAAVL